MRHVDATGPTYRAPDRCPPNCVSEDEAASRDRRGDSIIRSIRRVAAGVKTSSGRDPLSAVRTVTDPAVIEAIEATFMLSVYEARLLASRQLRGLAPPPLFPQLPRQLRARAAEAGLLARAPLAEDR